MKRLRVDIQGQKFSMGSYEEFETIIDNRRVGIISLGELKEEGKIVIYDDKSEKLREIFVSEGFMVTVTYINE